MATAKTTEATGDAESIVHLQSSHEGVIVERALVRSPTTDGGDTVGVWLRLTARGSRERAVRVVERLPASVDHADVGLHPEHGRQNWTRADDGLEFSTTVDGGETVTMYAVRDLAVVPVELATPPAVVEARVRDRSLTW